MSRGGRIEEGDREGERKLILSTKYGGRKGGARVPRMEITGGGDVNDVMQISAFFRLFSTSFSLLFSCWCGVSSETICFFYAVRIEAREMNACGTLHCMCLRTCSQSEAQPLFIFLLSEIKLSGLREGRKTPVLN